MVCARMGVLFRPACGVLFITMVVAATMHLDRGDDFVRTSHSVEVAILFLASLWLASGRLRLRWPLVGKTPT